MENILQRLAYLRGLADGLGIGDSREGDLLVQLIEVMEDTVSEISEEMESLSDYVDAVEEDLGELETYVYDDEFSEDDEDFDELDFLEDFEDFDEFPCCSEDCDCEDCLEEGKTLDEEV